MFSRIYFEISGVCNARCRWCKRGIKNLNGATPGKYVDFDEFKRSIFYLLENDFIDERSEIALYNWGEPFLHPRFKDIIKFLNVENLKIILSTNCSKAVIFEEEGILSNMQFIILSMPGFSQNSYDKIHGFNFGSILNNIFAIMMNFKNVGFKGSFVLAFHIYQFNLGEIQLAAEFAKQNQMAFMPSLALINDHDRLGKYIKYELEYGQLIKATQELFLFYLSEEMIKQRPKDYVCPQYELLVIDENCNVITCCGESTCMDKIFNVKVNHVNEWRMSGIACKKCRELGLDYIATPPPMSTVISFNLPSRNP